MKQYGGAPSKVTMDRLQNITSEQCRDFFDNLKEQNIKPRSVGIVNPITGRVIKKYESTFQEIIKACKGKMPLNEFQNSCIESNLDTKKVKCWYNNSPVESKRKSDPSVFTINHCKAFLKNPTMHPITKKAVNMSHTDEEFKLLMEQCKNVMTQEALNNYIKETAREMIPENYNGAMKCKNMLEGVNYNIDDKKGIAKDIDVPNIYISSSKKKQMISVDNPLIKSLLDRCEKSLFMRMILPKFVIPPSDNNDYTGTIVKYELWKKGEVGHSLQFEQGTLIILIKQIVRFIVTFSAVTNSEIKNSILDAYIDDLSFILDSTTTIPNDSSSPQKILISSFFYQQLQSCLFELQAIKNNIEIIHNESSSESRSSQRSKSLEHPEELPPLPKRTRAQILSELQTMCRHMSDAISSEDFENMKKKKLQLVVGIGKKDGNGKQSCYYVKNIYKYIESELKNKPFVKDPLTREKISEKDVEDVIMPKMKYVNLYVINPYSKRTKAKIPNIDLNININREEFSSRPFYSVGYIRWVAHFADMAFSELGYIPANIYVTERERQESGEHPTDVVTGSTNISSAVIIAKLIELNDKGLLTDLYGNPRVHINKSFKYWKGTKEDIIRKAVLMIQEFDNLLG